MGRLQHSRADARAGPLAPGQAGGRPRAVGRRPPPGGLGDLLCTFPGTNGELHAHTAGRAGQMRAACTPTVGGEGHAVLHGFSRDRDGRRRAVLLPGAAPQARGPQRPEEEVEPPRQEPKFGGPQGAVLTPPHVPWVRGEGPAPFPAPHRPSSWTERRGHAAGAACAGSSTLTRPESPRPAHNSVLWGQRRRHAGACLGTNSARRRLRWLPVCAPLSPDGSINCEQWVLLLLCGSLFKNLFAAL